MESKYFIFDGIKSSDMDLYNVHVDNNGLIEVPYFGGADISEEYNQKKLVPYFYGVKRKAIEFSVQFALSNDGIILKEWTPQIRNKIAKWLVHDTYKEFQTSDDLGKKYYVICTNPGNLHLRLTKGYVDLTFRTNSPFAWAGNSIIRYEDLSNNTNSKIINVENLSNIPRWFRPIIEIELVNGETDVELKNLSNGGKTMKFEGLTPNEIISIDCENELVLSNLFGSNPFSKFNVDTKRYWMDLVYGINQIEVKGKCKIWFKLDFPIVQ